MLPWQTQTDNLIFQLLQRWHNSGHHSSGLPLSAGQVASGWTGEMSATCDQPPHDRHAELFRSGLFYLFICSRFSPSLSNFNNMIKLTQNFLQCNLKVRVCLWHIKERFIRLYFVLHKYHFFLSMKKWRSIRNQDEDWLHFQKQSLRSLGLQELDQYCPR